MNAMHIIPALIYKDAVTTIDFLCNAFGFGSTVTFEHHSGEQRGKQFTLVGVDEASVTELRIAFTSPIARVLLGKMQNDMIEFSLGSTGQRLKIISIT